MKRQQMVAALLMFCSAVSACGPQRVMVPVPVPPERMDCSLLESGRPTIPPEFVIDWSGVATTQQARQQHDAFVQRLRQREGAVAGYVVELEGRVFACADDAAWLRDFNAGLRQP